MNDKRSIEETLPMSEGAYEAWNSGDLDDLAEAPPLKLAKAEPAVAPCFGCDRLVPVSSPFCSDECNDNYHGFAVQA